MVAKNKIPKRTGCLCYEVSANLERIADDVVPVRVGIAMDDDGASVVKPVARQLRQNAAPDRGIQHARHSLASPFSIGNPLAIQSCWKFVGRYNAFTSLNPHSCMARKAARMFGHFSHGQHPQ